MQFKAVLFDLFDTVLLIEKDEDFCVPCLRRLHKYLCDSGVDVPFEDFKRVYFEVRDAIYAETEKNLEEPHFNIRVSRVLRRFGYDFDASHPFVVGATEVFSNEFIRFVRLDDEALGVLRKLYGKCKLGLISNFAIPECAWRLLEESGLRQFFDVVLVSGDINLRKPSPKIFERALKALAVGASEAVFVGDMLGLDIKGAKNAGITAVLIDREHEQKVADVKPDKIVKNWKEFLAMVKVC